MFLIIHFEGDDTITEVLSADDIQLLKENAIAVYNISKPRPVAMLWHDGSQQMVEYEIPTKDELQERKLSSEDPFHVDEDDDGSDAENDEDAELAAELAALEEEPTVPPSGDSEEL